MHIPKQDTAGIDVLSFEEALAAANARRRTTMSAAGCTFRPPTRSTDIF